MADAEKFQSVTGFAHISSFGISQSASFIGGCQRGDRHDPWVDFDLFRENECFFLEEKPKRIAGKEIDFFQEKDATLFRFDMSGF